MGTRADFYVGRTSEAEWIGSIAFDGYPSGIDHDTFAIFRASTEEEYRTAVTAMFADRDDVTLPSMGWPWPWDDSGTTDYAYAFDGGTVYASGFGNPWFEVRAGDPDDESETGDSPTFPDMSAFKNVAYDNRSGAIFISAPAVSE